MEQVINITVSDVSVVNDTNEITIKINLALILEHIQQFEYIYAIVNLQIPIIESEITKNLVLKLANEYQTTPYNEENTIIVMTAEFGGEYDGTREVVGTCQVLGYNKTTTNR